MYKLSEESAREQWQIFKDNYEVDLNDVPAGPGREAMESLHQGIVRAIRRGRLDVEELSGVVTLTQHLKNPVGDIATLVWGEIKAQHKISLDNKPAEANYGKAYALAGAITGMGEGAILKLRGVDLSLVESLGAVFLQV